VASNDSLPDGGTEQGTDGPGLNDLMELEILREVDEDGNPVESSPGDAASNGDTGIMAEDRSAATAAEPAEAAELELELNGDETDAAPDPLEVLTEERDRLREDLLRAQADFINFRKRMEREKSEVVRRASQSLIEELLPVVDNFQLALANDEQSDPETWSEGVRLIHKQLLDLLNRKGLKEISCVGETFDPNIHEAVAVIQDPEVESNTVVAELKKGYTLRDRLIRSPLVQVVINQDEAPADDGGDNVDTDEPAED